VFYRLNQTRTKLSAKPGKRVGKGQSHQGKNHKEENSRKVENTKGKLRTGAKGGALTKKNEEFKFKGGKLVWKGDIHKRVSEAPRVRIRAPINRE